MQMPGGCIFKSGQQLSILAVRSMECRVDITISVNRSENGVGGGLQMGGRRWRSEGVAKNGRNKVQGDGIEGGYFSIP